jgi:hypothetical protein
MPTPTSLNGSYTGTLTIPRPGAVLVTIGKSRPLIGRNAFVAIEGEDYDGQSGITREDSNDNYGQAVVGNSGSWAHYENCDLSDGGVDSVQLRVNAISATTLTLTADSPTGTALGTCMIAATGGMYQTQTCMLTHTAGIKKLYVNFGGTVHLNWFSFSGPGAPDGGTGTSADGSTVTSPSTGTSTGETTQASGNGCGDSSSGGSGPGTVGGSGSSANDGNNGTGTGGGTATGGGGARAGGGGGAGGAGNSAGGSPTSGCGCSVLPDRSTGGWIAFAGIALAAIRRRRSLGRESGVALTTPECDQPDEAGSRRRRRRKPNSRPAKASSG